MKNKEVYRIIKRRSLISSQWVYQVQRRTKEYSRFLWIFETQEQWTDEGTIHTDLESAKAEVVQLQKYSNTSVVYRSDLDDVLEQEVLE